MRLLSQMATVAWGGASLAVLLAADPALAATASKAAFGTGADGAQVELITLKNDRGMTVKFSTRGGTITEIDAPDANGRVNNLVLGRPDFASWDRGGAFNSVVGRYANRISGGGFTLDRQFYALAGANPNTKVVIHGGPKGFGSQNWKAQTFQGPTESGAVMTYVSADGENGFPGQVTVKMTYTLTNQNVLRLAYEATTTKPTVINLTNHTYFNIGGWDSGPVYDQVMQVFASKWTPTDERQIPTGEIASVAGTPFDYRQPKTIAAGVYSTHPQVILAKGIDHNFIINRPNGAGMATAVRLRDPKTGRRMEVRTTEPGVQIYAGNNLNGAMIGAGGRNLRQGDGIAFETEHYPDSPNRPEFPSTVLRPGETFRSATEFAFSADPAPGGKRR